MSNEALLRILTTISLLGSAAPVCRLLWTSLYRLYPCFFLYLLLRVLVWSGSAIFPLHSAEYFRFFLISEPFFLILYILVVLELWRRILTKYKGLYTLGVWTLGLSVIVSATISVAALLPRFRPGINKMNKAMTYLMAAEPGVMLAMTVLLLAMVFLLSLYPVRLSRNLKVHVILYTLFFVMGTARVLLLRVFGLRLYYPVEIGIAAISSACVLGWFVLLRRDGEEAETRLPQLGPLDEDRLLKQLSVFNQGMLKLSGN